MITTQLLPYSIMVSKYLDKNCNPPRISGDNSYWRNFCNLAQKITDYYNMEWLCLPDDLK